MDFSVVLTKDEINLVFLALGELPAKTSIMLMNKLQYQIDEQLKVKDQKDNPENKK